MSDLESRISVGQQLHKVRLEPSSRLRSRLKGIRIATMGIISRARCIARAIALSARLDPDEGVFERVAGVGSGTHAKASADDVAPVTPGVLLGGLDAVTCCEGGE